MKTLTSILGICVIAFLGVMKKELSIKDRTNGKYELPNPKKSKVVKTYTV